jgi:hypothetical protein
MYFVFSFHKSVPEIQRISAPAALAAEVLYEEGDTHREMVYRIAYVVYRMSRSLIERRYSF